MKKTLPLGWLFWAFVASAAAQEAPPSPVGVTEAKTFAVRQQLELTGTVHTRAHSQVASEVQSIVAEVYVDVGARVKAGDPLLRLLTKRYQIQLREAKAQLKEAAAGLKLAENRLKRARELFAQKVFSSQEMEDALFDFQSREGGVERLRALIEQRELDVFRSVLRAPFDGAITAKLTEAGQWLASGQPAFDLVSLDELEVTVAMPEQYYARLSLGDRAEVSFDALPGMTVVGEVSAIVPLASEARTLPVKVSIANPDGRIPIGVLARTAFTSVSSRQAIIVPKDAIVPQGDSQAVFIVDDRQMVAPVAVQTGMGAGAWIEVIGEIKPGQRVVTLGNERLQPGQTVIAQPRKYDLP